MISILDQLHQQFVIPPKGFGTVPWWIWNGRMEYEQIEHQLKLMSDSGLEGWMLWARFGMEIEYLSTDFLSRVRFAVERSARLGLDVWIYDEYAWPSGTAQNRVVREHPEYRMRLLSCIQEPVDGDQMICRSYALRSGGSVIVPEPPASEGARANPEVEADGRRVERVIAVPVVRGVADVSKAQNITAYVHGNDLNWRAPAGQWLLLVLISRDNRSFVDSMNPAAVGAFISETHERYRGAVGDFFGTTIKGFFLDEPRYLRRGGEKPQYDEPTVPFTENLFARLGGAGVVDVDVAFASVFCTTETPGGNVVSARVGFWNAMATLYRDAYFGQLSEWSQRHGMAYAGDCFSEERVLLLGMGDYLRVASPLHFPGMDSLGDVPLSDREYRKAPKFPSSLAHRSGGRAMAEGPGLLGWDATLQRLKANSDWMLAYGISLFVPNAFFYTISHEQFYEPPSYFHQWTLWPHYRDYDRYIKRCAWILSQGTHQADVAIIYPTASLWANYSPPPMRMSDGEALQPSEMSATMREVYNGVVGLSDTLLRRQIDFDYVDEHWLEESRVVDGCVVIGEETFQSLLVPPTSYMSRSTLEKLAELSAGGASVIATGMCPTNFLDNLAENSAVASKHIQTMTVDQACASIKPQVCIETADSTSVTDCFATHARRVGEVSAVFISNFSTAAQTVRVRIRTDKSGVEIWDASTGERRSCAGEYKDGYFAFDHAFAPNESVLLVCSDTISPASQTPARRRVLLELPPEWEFAALDDNLFLPPELHVRHQWTEWRAWEGLCTYTYEFPLRLSAVPERLFVVLDHVQTAWRLARLRLHVNGVASVIAPSSLIDHEMLQCEIASLVRAGENAICIELDYTDYADVSTDLHNKRTSPPAMPKVRVMGSFTFTGTELSPARSQRTGYGSWTQLGHPLYSGRGSYRTRFDVPAGMLEKSLWLTFQALADVVEVRINGQMVGKVLWPPLEIEVSEMLKPTGNELELIVTNAQANQMYEQPRAAGLLGVVSLEVKV